MGTNQPRTKDFFATPALSLSLARVFWDAPAVTSGEEAEAGGEGSGGQGEAVEISNDNTALGIQSDDSKGEAGGKKRRRKNYHRHTVEQIRVMEALFKESPHPDEKQRQQLSKQLGLSARQVKFWFQNRRTQIKAIQERHENSLLRSELEKLQEENLAMRETINKFCCPHCGLASSSTNDTAVITEEQQLRLENVKLTAEIENLRGMQGKAADGISSLGLLCSGAAQKNRSSVDDYRGFLGHNKSRILELVNRALDELTKMSSSREPLWVRSFETGRDILNYDEYVRAFPHDDDHADPQAGWSVEASRGSAVVFLDIMQLVHAFMDANQWKELFPSMISKAATLDVIRTGENDGRDGVVQLMFAEFHMLTPIVPTREFYFVRYCNKLSEEKWAIVDVSVDKVEADVNASSSVKCWKMPSGCIMEEQVNGHCKVAWVEHTKCQKSTTPSTYQTVIASGLAFGAKRWMASLQVQCERMVFSMATNVPTKDSNGVPTLAGRKSILKLTQRMTTSFCRTIGGSRDLTCKKVSKGGDDILLTSRKNIGEPGEPQGLIACAVLSTWLPVNPTVLFNFLKDEPRCAEWDVMLPEGPVQAYVNLSKGKNRGNCVKAYANKSAEQNGQWILQDNCTNSSESLITYSPVDVHSMQRVIHGHDSSDVAVLPCGFSILPDGLESKPTVITSREEKTVEGGSLITLALQIKASSSPAARLSPDSVETLTSLVSCKLRNIRKALRCEDR